MTATKFTPAPWSHHGQAIYSGKTYIAQCMSHDAADLFGPTLVSANDKVPQTDLESDANARLIATAPELLEQLKDLTGFVTKFGDTQDRAAFMRAADGYLVAARSAITKATL